MIFLWSSARIQTIVESGVLCDIYAENDIVKITPEFM